MENKVFYRCNICGNLVGVIEDSGVTPICCGESMEMLKPGTTDGAHEKHVPVIECEDKKVTVRVGESAHPMSDVHYIEWIYLKTNKGGHMRKLSPGEKPEAKFRICDSEKVEAAYAYCNVHGLWVGIRQHDGCSDQY